MDETVHLVRQVNGKDVKTLKEFDDAMSAAQRQELVVHNSEGLSIVTLQVGGKSEE